MPSKQLIKVLSYNIHKGFASGRRKFVLHEIREMLRDTGADLVFLQEVIGENHSHAQKISTWPPIPQYEFLADSVWSEYRYGQNSTYDGGHHGNVILSRFPILESENRDISTNRHERRGILHAVIELQKMRSVFHVSCTHLGLTQRGRSTQLTTLSSWLASKVPSDAPLILAGDFNDWLKTASRILARELNVTEVIEKAHGKLSGTFPARLPILSLDRIYVRGMQIVEARILREKVWRVLSDHVPVLATLELHSHQPLQG